MSSGDKAARIFKHTLVRQKVSDGLYSEISAAAHLYKFNDEQHALSWARKLPDALFSEIILAGLIKSIAGSRERLHLGGPARVVQSARVSAARQAATREKARLLDRVIEALDARQIGDKRLGDCTRADLLREAYRLDAEAAEMTLDATLYRAIAALIGNATVREYSDRGQVVALLTSRFADDGAAPPVKLSVNT